MSDIDLNFSSSYEFYTLVINAKNDALHLLRILPF